MTKKRIWVLLLAACAVCVLLAAAAAGGLYLYIQHRNARWLTTGENAFSQGHWEEAKRYFGLYLVQHPDDEATLTKFAEANLNMLQNRREALRQAATAYRQLLQYNPGSQEIIDKLFELYEKTGSWVQIEYYANDMLRTRPNDEALIFRRAVALDKLGRRDEAIDLYRPLAEAGTARVEVYGNLARLLRDRGYEQQASDLLDKAVEARPQDPALRVERAHYYALTRNWSLQEADLAEAVRLAPGNPEVLALQAQDAVSKKEWDRAIELCTKAIEQLPDRVDLWLMKAHALTRKGMPKEAAAFLASLKPMTLADNPDVLVTLADLQISIADYEEADRTNLFFQKAYPERVAMIDYLAARKLLAQGDAETAATKLASVSERLPEFAPAQFYLAQAYRANGKEELARSTLEAYLKKRPDDARARAMLAVGTGATASLTELESTADRILQRSKEEQAPSEPQACVSTALALFDATVKEGDPESRLDVIKELLEQAIKGDRQSPDAYRAYTDVLVAVNDLPAAHAVLQRAKEAGISEHLLAPTEAGLALSEGDNARAWALCETDTTRPEAAVEDVVRWSSLFAARNQLKLAEDVLALGVNRVEQGGLSSAQRPPESAAALLRIERILLTARTGKASDALAQYQEFEQSGLAAQSDMHPRLNEARLTVAEQLLSGGNEEQRAPALALLEQVRQEEPQNTGLQILDARIFLEQKPPDLERAEALFQRASEADAGNPGAWMGLGQVSSMKGNFVKAAEYVERAAALAPNSAAIQLQLAQLQIRLGRYLMAEKVLTNVLGRLREDAKEDRIVALEMLAGCHIAGQRFMDAEDAIARLESVAGQDSAWAERVAALKSNLLVAKGGADAQSAGQALEALRQQYEADPDNLSLMLNLTTALQQASQSDEAERILKEYADRHETNVDAWLALARFYLGNESPSSTERLMRASAALTRALVVDPNCLPALQDMIEVQTRSGKLAEALALCDRFLEANPKDPVILHRKATLVARMAGGQRFELLQAIELLDKAIALEDRPEFSGTKGMILLALKDYEGALKSLQPLARGHQETSAELDAALADAYLGTGQQDMALQYLTSAQQKADQGQPVDRRMLERIAEALNKN